jgi:ribosomal protein S18 acetylase RimI-like enzyme
VRPGLPLRQVRPGGEMLNVEVLRNREALAALAPGSIVALTEQATRATFYHDELTMEQVRANQRIPAISEQACLDAAVSDHQHLAAAFDAGRLAGFMIATRHAPGDHELDWLMVHPDQHGSGLAAALMAEGTEWLGADRPMWLTVIQHNHRAISFYRKFGFEIDRTAILDRPVATWIMRRQTTG